MFGTVANVGDRVHSATRERTHDEAFLAASQEVKVHFVQCPRCSECGSPLSANAKFCPECGAKQSQR